MTHNPYQSPESPPDDPTPWYDSPLLNAFIVVLTLCALAIILWPVVMRDS